MEDLTNSDSIMLSDRGKYTYKYMEFLAMTLTHCNENTFHPLDNPKGYVNMGTAANFLMDKEISEKFNQNAAFNFLPEEHQHYYDFPGKLPLRNAISVFLNRFLSPPGKISSDDLVIMSGTAACLDSLSYALFDPQDIFLTPIPTYGRIFTDFNNRSLAQPHPLELPEQPDSNGKSFSLSSELLEKRILQLKEEGKSVKGFVLINPQNPLGDIYSPQLLRSVLQVCAKYEIHVIIDEVYMFSLLNNETKVTSVMSLSGLPDPQRTHVVWALSKDLGLAGFRVGVIYTKNCALKKVLQDLSIYNCSASIIQDAAAFIINDLEWLEEVYFPIYRRRLQEHHQICVNRLHKMGVYVRPSQAGLFVWVNMKKFLTSDTDESELELFKALFEAKLYIVPGRELYCNSPGWFRITFSVTKENLETGLDILESVLKKQIH